MEMTELDPDVQEGLERLGIEVGGLFSDEDLMGAAEALEPNSSAALLIWENVWARKVPRRCGTPAESWSRSSGFRTTSSRKHASWRSKQPRPKQTRGELK